MSRPLRARGLVPLLLLVAAGCQDYNFNPVGHCLVQPGTERVTLSDVSTADVLFVVDDSGSMAAEQQRLAANFWRFIQNLNDTNLARAASGLEPIDFHVAVTTTSIFWNYAAGTCSSTCGSASGQLVCCAGTTPVVRPKTCSGSGAACPGGATCSNTCDGFKGEYRCCNAADGSMNLSATEPLACGLAGAQCGDIQHNYDFSTCGGAGTTNGGVAADGYPYPRGDFVGWNGNPRVLHFDKTLYPAAQQCSAAVACASGQACVAGVCRTSCSASAPCAANFTCVSGACIPTNAQGFTSDQLVASFVGGTGVGGASVGGNVIVGTCGSGEEQALQAGRLAVQKAVAGQQKDTYDATGKATWNATDRSATASASWLHDKSKLALVFIGDEDDCSSPDDSARGVVMISNAQIPGTPGNDACTADSSSPNPKQFAVQEIVDYFAGLGRPLGAAFIASAAQTVCGRDLVSGEQLLSCAPYASQCTPGVCLQENCPTAGVCTTDSTTNFCGGQAGGFRLFGAADALRAKGADVVEGSICDSGFGEILNQVAEIVKPPSGLVLPTLPADGQITLLRIAKSDGQTRSLCKGPAPAGTTGATLNQYDWWFTATRDGSGDPMAVSRYVFINHSTGHCEANPGETYSADYIAQQPAGGCTVRADCSNALGGQTADWGCYIAPGAQVGTCICCGANSTDPACSAP
jgi:hypothetical protein